MKTKQIVGIVITCLIIIATGVTGIFSNVVGNRIIKAQNEANKGLVSELLQSQNTKVDLPSGDFIGVINIEGTIGASSATSWASSSVYNHDLYRPDGNSQQ